MMVEGDNKAKVAIILLALFIKQKKKNWNEFYFKCSYFLLRNLWLMDWSLRFTTKGYNGVLANNVLGQKKI